MLSGQLVRGMSAGCRVWEYIEVKPHMLLGAGWTLSAECLHGNIKFDNVTFTYPARPDQVPNACLCVPMWDVCQASWYCGCVVVIGRRDEEVRSHWCMVHIQCSGFT